MKQLLLMFVILTTSIINAQTFDFGCEDPATYKTELAAIFASDTAPTALTGLLYDEAHRLSNTQDFAIKRNLFTVDLTGDGITVTITSNPDTFHVTGPNETVGVEYEPFNLATGAASRYKEIFFEVLLAKWNLLYPNSVDLSALRTERLAEIAALGPENVPGEVTVKYVTSATKGDGFSVFLVSTDKEYVYTRDSGADLIENLTTTEYASYKAAVIAEAINQDPNYVGPGTAAALRADRIAEALLLDDGKDYASVVINIKTGSDNVSVNNEFNFRTSNYQTGAIKIEDLTDTNWKSLIASVTETIEQLNPLYDLLEELNTFYALTSIDEFNQVNYGNKLPTKLEAAANEAFDNGLAAQEAFIKLLATGASFKGGDSHVIWNSTSNYYHIVTSNVGSGNGYFDIRLDDNHHYLPGASGTITKTNFRHLAWHTMSNLWHLAGTTDEELVVFRETEMTVYADLNPNKSCTCDWRAGSYESNGITVYRAQWENFSWDYVPDFRAFPVDGYQSGAKKIDDLSAANWDQMLTEWKAEVDIST